MSEIGSQELYLKPGAFVRLADDGVEKRMTANEVAAYRVLADYEDTLHDDTVSVVVPRLLEYDEGSQMGLLSKVGDFQSFSAMEYFGQGGFYTPSYYTAMHGVARVLRKTIPSDAVRNTFDYEAVHEGRISSIHYLASGLTGEEPNNVTVLVGVAGAVAERTQERIKNLPLLASHRDPNPNNFLVREEAGKYQVAVVDWETFGLSRSGYDEGRLMSYLALDPDKQAEYAQYIQKVLTPDEQVYFWRVAVNRSVRELISITNGHYDMRLGGWREAPAHVLYRQQKIARGLARAVFRAIDALEDLGV